MIFNLKNKQKTIFFFLNLLTITLKTLYVEWGIFVIFITPILIVPNYIMIKRNIGISSEIKC